MDLAARLKLLLLSFALIPLLVFAQKTYSQIDPAPAKPLVIVTCDAESGDQIHLILEATDNAELPLTKYHRLIINVK